MNLAIVANGDFFSTYGGGQVYVKNLVDELIARQESDHLHLTVISIGSHFPTIPASKDYLGVLLYEVSPQGNLIKLLSQISPNIMHIHGEKSRLVEICSQLHIPCVVTAHHGGICCPAGALLNSKDQICCEPSGLKQCLSCYLRNIHTGRYWYPIVKILPVRLYLQLGKTLKKLPFIPFLSPIGEAMISIDEKFHQWENIKEHATHIVAPSNAIASSMILNGCDKDKISVIPHGIPVPSAPKVSYINSVQHEHIHFYYVGRLCYVKGIHVLLKAFSMLKYNDITLHLIGGTGNKDEERYARRLKKQYASDTRIVWHGKMTSEQVTELAREYHCMVHPTICMEIFGLNISEAQAIGKYVIATRCGGAEMQIHSAKEGLLVAPNSVSELTAAIRDYISNPLLSQAKVNSIENHVSELLSLYRSLRPIQK